LLTSVNRVTLASLCPEWENDFVTIIKAEKSTSLNGN